jgi:integrase
MIARNSSLHSSPSLIMARRPSLWFRKSTGYWCTTVNGKQIRLAQDKKEAEKAFHSLMLMEDRKAAPVYLRPTFQKVADDFLEHSRRVNAPSTHGTHLRFLQSFSDHIGKRRAHDIRGEHVTSWLRNHPTWGQSTRSLALQAVQAALNFAVTEGHLRENPLQKVKREQIKSRTRILTQEEREKIRALVARHPSFADFFFALEHTGARPFSEVARLESRFINWEQSTAELPEHKTAKHGKKRILDLAPEVMELLKRLAEKHPTGLLFRNQIGGAWDRFSFNKWTATFERELGIKGVTGYALRHSYATDAITRGVPLPLLAELMGTSVKMLLAHYSHMSQKKEALHAAARRALGTQ